MANDGLRYRYGKGEIPPETAGRSWESRFGYQGVPKNKQLVPLKRSPWSAGANAIKKAGSFLKGSLLGPSGVAGAGIEYNRSQLEDDVRSNDIGLDTAIRGVAAVVGDSILNNSTPELLDKGIRAWNAKENARKDRAREALDQARLDSRAEAELSEETPISPEMQVRMDRDRITEQANAASNKLAYDETMRLARLNQAMKGRSLRSPEELKTAAQTVVNTGASDPVQGNNLRRPNGPVTKAYNDYSRPPSVALSDGVDRGDFNGGLTQLSLPPSAGSRGTFSVLDSGRGGSSKGGIDTDALIRSYPKDQREAVGQELANPLSRLSLTIKANTAADPNSHNWADIGRIRQVAKNSRAMLRDMDKRESEAMKNEIDNRRLGQEFLRLNNTRDYEEGVLKHYERSDANQAEQIKATSQTTLANAKKDAEKFLQVQGKNRFDQISKMYGPEAQNFMSVLQTMPESFEKELGLSRDLRSMTDQQLGTFMKAFNQAKSHLTNKGTNDYIPFNEYSPEERAALLRPKILEALQKMRRSSGG